MFVKYYQDLKKHSSLGSDLLLSEILSDLRESIRLPSVEILSFGFIFHHVQKTSNKLN